ncbi:MAG: 50S ribosomal protein L10 [bacterium]
MNKSEKELMISQIKEKLVGSIAVLVIDYRGIKVEDVTKLRRAFKAEGVDYKVYKNTLVSKALESLNVYPEFQDLLVGMTGIVFAPENFVGAAKIIKKLSDDKGKITFKGCYIDGEFYGADSLATIASMPTKSEIISGIIGSIAAPASGIVGVINAVIRDLVNVVDQISKKEAA